MDDRDRCPEAFRHGPLDRAGRCPWCGRKVGAAVPAPAHAKVPADLTQAWAEFYDPDWDTLTPTEIRRRYEMGQGWGS